MVFGYPSNQSEAQAAAVALGGEERLEGPSQGVCGKTGAVVFDCDLQITVGGLHRHPDVAALAHGVQGVLDQIHHGSRDEPSVEMSAGQVLRNVQAEGYTDGKAGAIRAKYPALQPKFDAT